MDVSLRQLHSLRSCWWEGGEATFYTLRAQPCQPLSEASQCRLCHYCNKTRHPFSAVALARRSLCCRGVPLFTVSSFAHQLRSVPGRIRTTITNNPAALYTYIYIHTHTQTHTARIMVRAAATGVSSSSGRKRKKKK